jgi:hypothetical protein
MIDRDLQCDNIRDAYSGDMSSGASHSCTRCQPNALFTIENILVPPPRILLSPYYLPELCESSREFELLLAKQTSENKAGRQSLERVSVPENSGSIPKAETLGVFLPTCVLRGESSLLDSAAEKPVQKLRRLKNARLTFGGE